MKIDMQPVIEKADADTAMVMEAYECEACYIIRLANGTQYSTVFDAKSLEEFQPNQTVSEVIEEWEQNIIRRLEEAKEAIRTGLHPTRTFKREIMIPYPKGEIPSGRFETVRSPLDTYEKRSYKHLIKTLTEQLGSMVFVKIIP